MFQFRRSVCSMGYCRWSLCLSTMVALFLGPLGIYGWTTQCRCVPEQWEGILSSTEREFDMVGGRTMSTDNKLFVSYDYKNKLFAITDADSGNRAIADYAKVKINYLIWDRLNVQERVESYYYHDFSIVMMSCTV